MSVDESLSTLSTSAVYRDQLAVAEEVLVEVARRRADDMPGLVEAIEESVVYVADVPAHRHARGYTLPGCWVHGEDRPTEVVIGADQLGDPAQVFMILLHEACHVHAHKLGVKDTSRQGRWHNRQFAELAETIGLEVLPSDHVGVWTPRVTDEAALEYGDLMARLAESLTLHKPPAAVRRGRVSQYLTFRCRCDPPVSARVALGNYSSTLVCTDCQSRLEPNVVPTEHEKLSGSIPPRGLLWLSVYGSEGLRDGACVTARKLVTADAETLEKAAKSNQREAEHCLEQARALRWLAMVPPNQRAPFIDQARDEFYRIHSLVEDDADL